MPKLRQSASDAGQFAALYAACQLFRAVLGRLRLYAVHGCRSRNRLDTCDAGLTDEQIRHIDDPQHPCFDPADRAVFALADLVSLKGVGALGAAQHPLGFRHT